ncbi:MAG: glutaminyl-peptide cyclotransferase, partial [Thermoanaerobaculia bacterium]|nr:glutaminyl-peptide cyclotransferase [Thermoanaerobaculia bacterium]
LTWREGIALVWDRETLAPLDRISYRGEGWGLCYDGSRLVMSDGSARLTLRDARTLERLGHLRVSDGSRPVRQLNELECAEGWIFANVLGSDRIARIDPTDGRVTAWIDASGLLAPDVRRRADVLNGIAYRQESESFYLTGKLWPTVFEVVFEPGA